MLEGNVIWVQQLYRNRHWGWFLGLGPRQSSIVMNLHYLISIRIVLILSVIAYTIEPCTMHIVLSFLLQLQPNCLAFSIACVILEAIYTPDEVWGRDETLLYG